MAGKTKITENIGKYFTQLTEGCGNSRCSNVICQSCLDFKYDRKLFLDRNQAAAEAIKLFVQNAEICLNENKQIINQEKLKIITLSEEYLQKLIDACRKNKTYDELKSIIATIFSNRIILSSSFLKIKYISTSNSTKTQWPKSKHNVEENSQIPLEDDEITLDFELMNRSINLLMSVEEIEETIHKSLHSLLDKLMYELKSPQKHEIEMKRNFLNIFFTIFHVSILSDPMFIYDTASSFYSILTQLSIDVQTKFVRVLSKNINYIDRYVSHVQQYITLHTLRWCERTQNNDNSDELLSDQPGMKEGINALRLLFYGNLLSSQRDPEEILDIENRYDRKMKTKLKQHRQFLNNVQEENLQHASIENDDQNETLFSYKNPLEAKLKIKVNEYRHIRFPFNEFINDLANEKLAIKTEFFNFLELPISINNKFSFIFYPFFLSTINKIALLNVESRARMFMRRRSVFINYMFNPNPVELNLANMYFKICVRRDHLIEDALITLEYQGIEEPDELKKQLFVEFDGEQAHDEGGLSKEFFQLITEQIFSVEYGMFMTTQETRCLWFNPSATEDLAREYTLIGMLLGLAIYNSIILDVKFPPVIYRKLMGKIGVFEDMETSHPAIYNSLTYLLAFNEQEENTTIEQAFGLTFRVSITDAIGSQLEFNLKDNGDKISVTKDNRKEFVNLYSDLLLNKSIEKQFHPFYHGFLLVTRDSSLKKLFRPDEIELLVAGSQTFDFSQLALAAVYDGGYTEDSPTIKHFWKVLMNFTDKEKRDFLRFTTGSDRVPIGGLSKLKLIITRNGPDDDRLPTAQTCYNALLLPDYSSIEKLQMKLSIAINNSKGFGLR